MIFKKKKRIVILLKTEITNIYCLAFKLKQQTCTKGPKTQGNWKGYYEPIDFYA
tara:strand:- start:1020 stop:1181 length:162 start_codon:yes stop_codon:yes gene_type:complete